MSNRLFTIGQLLFNINLNMNKYKILVYNQDTHGVGFYRMTQPALQLNKDYSDIFDIEINPLADVNNDDYIKQFSMIWCHRTIVDYNNMESYMKKMRSFGIKVVLDIDDYWSVPETHYLYHDLKASGLAKMIINNIKLVDAVTTTNPYFASLIRPFNKNVFVIENGIDTSLDQYNEEKNNSKFTRIGYLGGSSHYEDLSLLKDGFEIMLNDSSIENKYQFNLVGWDLRGTMTENKVNDELYREFVEEMQNVYKIQYTRELANLLAKAGQDLSRINNFPQPLVEKYNNKLVTRTQRAIKPTESIWYKYEKDIFTSNYKLIKDKNYYEYLMEFNLNDRFGNELEEQPYVRHKTDGIYEFAKNYKHIDVALAPLKVTGKVKNGILLMNDNNNFQLCKSNLKILESAFYKTPIICSEISTYTYDKDFQHGKNILFVSPERQEKDWYKNIKRLINNPNERIDMGLLAYETVKDKYNLKTLTEKRKDIYLSILK